MTSIMRQGHNYTPRALHKLTPRALTRPMKRPKRRPTYLKEWRKFRDLNQERLADRMGVTQETVSRLERGKIEYTQHVLEAAAHALGCDPADLFRPPDPPENELAAFILALDARRKEQALRILKAAMTEPVDKTDAA